MERHAVNVGESLTEMRTLGPDECALWARDYSFAHQRPVTRTWVRELAARMARGTFSGGTIDLRSPDGEHWVVVNGQHRLLAAALAGLPLETALVWKRCADWDEVGEDYGTFDRGRARSMMDVFRSNGVLEGLELSLTQASQLSKGVSVIMQGFEGVSAGRGTAGDADIRAELMREWADEAKQWFQATEHRDVGVTRALNNGPTVAVGLVTLRHQGELAAPFWREVASNAGLVEDSGQQRLVSVFGHVSLRTVGAANYARCVATCWNAHFEGRQIRLVKPGSYRTPIQIKGSPYNGTRVIRPRDKYEQVLQDAMDRRLEATAALAPPDFQQKKELTHA